MQITKTQIEVIVQFLNDYKKICCGNICEKHNQAVYLCKEYKNLLKKYGVENVKEDSD